jgi:predicted HTH domain antitoxin
MSLTVKLEFSENIEKMLRAGSANLDTEVRDAYALELFRQGRLSHYELSQALGLDRFETDGYLKRHNVYEGSLTLEDLKEQDRTVARVMERMKSQ